MMRDHVACMRAPLHGSIMRRAPDGLTSVCTRMGTRGSVLCGHARGTLNAVYALNIVTAISNGIEAFETMLKRELITTLDEIK